MLAFQWLYLFFLVSGYATEESHLTFRGSPGGWLVLPLSFYIPWDACISEDVSFFLSERLRDLGKSLDFPRFARRTSCTTFIILPLLILQHDRRFLTHHQ